MRRPVNWFVFCLSLAFLFANVTFGRRTDPAVDLAMLPLVAQSAFPKVFVEDRAAVQFGYVRDDGSFEPLPEQPATQTDAEEAVWSPWAETTRAVSQVTSASPSWQ